MPRKRLRRMPRIPLVVNDTPFDATDLIRFVQVCIDFRGVYGKVTEVEFKVRSPRGDYAGNVNGLAYLGPDRIEVMIPAAWCEKRALSKWQRVKLAQVFLHEWDHIAHKVDHPQMAHGGMHWMLEVPAKLPLIRRA